jgi:PPOX class probable F420-dependent enzyme
VTPEEARSRFVDARVAHLATADAEGIPHIVPITFALEADRIYTAIDAKPKGSGPLRRLENVAVNPRVSVLVDRYDADWRQLWWARADGSASVVSSGATFDHALALLRARYPQYAETELIGPAMVIRVGRWSGWSASIV